MEWCPSELLFKQVPVGNDSHKRPMPRHSMQQRTQRGVTSRAHTLNKMHGSDYRSVSFIRLESWNGMVPTSEFWPRILTNIQQACQRSSTTLHSQFATFP
eukprot:TRINITY_DN25368_c0_g2_i1.p1 TRINITY_DN25368_c0_g2~~TRINITY_DN25368_c0_g2_i1.p1  ORF type:complete len:100 (+),score=5.17 TRINITY_DN25368_c0_g2_i1:600-899(+)